MQHPGSALRPRTLLDEVFWSELAPELHIGEPDAFQGISTLAFTEPDLAAIHRDLKKEGYTRVHDGDGQLPVDALARTIARIDGECGLPILGFVYDECWVWFARLRPFLESVLGPGYRAMPAFWAWHVAPRDDDHGWAPHRDAGRRTLFTDGRPKSLTVWSPLTDAVPENGCIYLVPADRDPTYNTDEEATWRFDLSDVRAVPATAGTVLAWNQAIVHWGARSSARARQPRISLSLESQRGDAEALDRPLLDPTALPPFEVRLKLIAKQLLQYRHKHALSPDAERLVSAIIEL